MKGKADRIETTTCASHCGGSCVLKLHMIDGVVAHIETDDGDDLQLRACLRGRAYRQRVYAPDRLLYPMKRVGERGEGKLVRISWDEAVDTVCRAIERVRDSYGSASILYLPMGGDIGSLHTTSQTARFLAQSGGYTASWGATSFQAGMYASQITYGSIYTSNTRDDLVNAKLILMWGWNPASTVTGVNTNYFLMKAKNQGTKIVAIDPRYTESAASFAEQWIPIRPCTDGALLLAMAYVMIQENLQDQAFIDKYTIGFEQFKAYVLGMEDGVAKSPEWAETITGVSAATISELARAYGSTKPAALLAGIAPGRTANGEQYHRIAITLAAMTGNVGVHGGDAAGRAWESLVGGYPYALDGHVYVERLSRNVIDDANRARPKGASPGYRPTRVHRGDLPRFIEEGKAGGFPADCRLIAVVNFSLVNAMPNVNRVAQALRSKKLDFIFVQEQFMTPTVKFADIVLPTNTYFERNDFARGVGLAFYGNQPKAIESLGESKSHYEIAQLLARRLGLEGWEKSEEEWLREMVAASEMRDYDNLKAHSIYRLQDDKPYVAFEAQIAEANVAFPTPSGKIEIYSRRLEELGNPLIPGIPKYYEAWEGWSDPLRDKYPLQMISTHMKRRANTQFDNMPWLREVEPQAVLVNAADAGLRGIRSGDIVRVFNDRGSILVPAGVTERIMPGVVDVPQGAWYDPDEQGNDKGGCANVLTRDELSPGAAFAYNSCLVQMEKWVK